MPISSLKMRRRLNTSFASRFGELLHALVKQNPDLKSWADSVQDCVYGVLEGEKKDSCKAVYSEHIGDETKHAVWRIVEMDKVYEAM
jgi:hypothetical protein